MTDFPFKKEDNLGGVPRFNFVKVSDVQSIGIAVNHKIIAPVVLKTGKQWYCGYGTLGTVGYSEPEESSSAGTLYKRAFSGFYPKDDADIDLLFSEMRHEKFLIDYTDNNGLRKLIGSIAEPLRFTSSFSTKQQASELAGHTFSFYGDGTHKSYVYFI